MRRPRGDSITEIWEFCYGYGNRGGASRTEIANNLGLKKSPHLTGIINEMVERGLLECYTDTLNNGVALYRYRALEQ